MSSDLCIKCLDTRDESALVCAACWDEKDQELIGASLVMATAEGERDEAEDAARRYAEALITIVAKPWWRHPSGRGFACPRCGGHSACGHMPGCMFHFAAKALGIA